MDAILRALIIYVFLLVLLRASGGKRSLSQITTFDFILLLIIGEVTQQALLGDDYSITNAAITILALVSFDIFLTLIKRRSKGLELFLEGTPLVILKNGQLIKDRAAKSRLEESDVLEAGRNKLGLERLDQIKYAVLEKDGGITVIPQPSVAVPKGTKAKG